MVKGLRQDAQGYMTKQNQPPQVPLVADKADEPKDDKIIMMLEALPEMEAQFYAEEKNVIDTTAKCPQHVEILTEQYGFYGGSLDEVIKYFSREDLPSNMWRWQLFPQVKAVAVV